MRWLRFLKYHHLEHDFYWFRLNVYTAGNIGLCPTWKSFVQMEVHACDHCRWRAAKFGSMFIPYGFWYTCTDTGLCIVIRKSTPFSCHILGSCLPWHVRGTVKLLYPKSQRDFIWFLMNSIYILQWNLSNQNSTGRLVLVLEYFNKQSFRLNSVKRKHRI